MKVKVFPPLGCDRSSLDRKSWAELPEGSTVGDVLRIIKSLQFCDEVIKGIKTIPLKPKELLFYFLSNCFL